MDLIDTFFDGNYMPHGHCLLWKPDLLLMHVGSDILIMLSYFAIPLAMLFYGRRKPVPFTNVLILFSVFIFGCGITHLMSVVNVWNGYYYIHGATKVFTAIVSFTTAFLVWKLLPSWLEAPSLLELNTIQKRLEKGNITLKPGELVEVRDYLSEQIKKRTEELEYEIQKREEAEQNLNQIIESAANGLILVDNQGKITKSNEKAEAIFALYDELNGQNVSDLVDRPMKKTHQGFVETFFKAPDIKTMAQGRMVKYRSPDGITKTLNIELQPYQQDGQSYCLATITDVSIMSDLVNKLNQSELKFRTISESVDAVLWLATPQLSKILYVNPAYENLWHASCESLYQNPLSYFNKVHPEDRKILQQRGEGDTPIWDIQYRLRLDNGDIRYIREKGKKVCSDSGDAIFLVGMAMDISDSLALEKVQKKYELAISAIRDGVYDWDIQNNTIDASNQLKLIHGVAENQLWTYELWRSKVDADYIEEVESKIEQHLAGKSESFYAEYPTQVNGERKWMLTRGRVVERDANGKAMRMMGVESDITHRKKIEEQLWLVEQKLSAVQSSSVDGLIFTDTQFNILEVNQAFSQLLNLTSAELEGRNISEFTPQQFRQKENDILKQQLIPLGYCDEYEKEIISHGQQNVPVSVRSWAVKNNRGSIIGFMGLIRDISARKAAEQTIQNTLAELQRKNHELDQFVHAASHDLKEPSRGLMHISQFLFEDYSQHLDDTGQKYILTIRAAAERMSKLIDTLLKFSRTGRREIHRESVDVEKLIDEVVEQSQFAREIKISTKFDASIIEVDRVSIFEIYQNLISNAVKYNNQSVAAIEVGSLNGLYWVKDNGLGIDKECLDQAFIIFKRFDQSKEGEGVGLSIVRKLVELHGGKVWAESESGVGTQIYFTLTSKEVDSA
ncbi:PAS domain-containing sensor histidine kinase [Catenovulum sediminis]|uniref:histidine kinase n=1 Tax=Catenovulum sediminis TaxID=1740262 RepID=A0ABV1RIC2_9ALTE